MGKKTRTNKAYASLLGIDEVQRLNLRLMETATFNRFDGPKVVKDLLDHEDLWQACIMDRESYCTSANIDRYKNAVVINLIKLRDMGDDTTKRLGRQTWNVDTLFILVKHSKDFQGKLERLAKKWHADEIDWIEWQLADHLLGGSLPGTRILRVWWD